MVKGVSRLRERSENATGDELNAEKHVKELTDVCAEMLRAPGAFFERDHLRFINAPTRLRHLEVVDQEV